MSAPGFLESISPWASRSNTPRPSQGKGGDTSPQLGLNNQSGTDHAVTRRHRLSIRDYPDDCPKIAVKWFYAVDVRGSVAYIEYGLLKVHHSSQSGSL